MYPQSTPMDQQMSAVDSVPSPTIQSTLQSNGGVTANPTLTDVMFATPAVELSPASTQREETAPAAQEPQSTGSSSGNNSDNNNSASERTLRSQLARPEMRLSIQFLLFIIPFGILLLIRTIFTYESGEY